MPIISAGIVVETIRYNLLQQLRALRNVHIPTAISIVGLFISILASITLGLKTEMSIYVVAAGFAGGVGLTAGGIFSFWSKKVQVEIIKRSNERNFDASLQLGVNNRFSV